MSTSISAGIGNLPCFTITRCIIKEEILIFRSVTTLLALECGVCGSYRLKSGHMHSCVICNSKCVNR